jgi:Sec-independent protein translocase protein TatA
LTPRLWFTIIGERIGRAATAWRREDTEYWRWTASLGIVEIIVILAVALIVIPPENLPDVMRATGKILRELRLASNMVVRELGGALDQPSDNRAAPPINPMRPGADSNNIAQSAPPADTTPAAPPAASSEPHEAAAEATVASTAAAPSEAGASSATPATDLKAIV